MPSEGSFSVTRHNLRGRLRPAPAEKPTFRASGDDEQGWRLTAAFCRVKKAFYSFVSNSRSTINLYKSLSQNPLCSVHKRKSQCILNNTKRPFFLTSDKFSQFTLRTENMWQWFELISHHLFYVTAQVVKGYIYSWISRHHCTSLSVCSGGN